jgi:hypothetical protein
VNVPAPERCPLCQGPARATDLRCPDCGMDLAGVGARPGPFGPTALWWWAGGLLAIYLLVLAIVALVP